MKTTTISQILLATSAVSAATLPRRDNTVVRRTPTSVTENYVPLKRAHRGARTVMRRGARPGPMTLAANQFYPVAEVTFGDEVIPVLVDTGSSDTWVVRGNFSCVTQESKPVKDATECNIPNTLDKEPSGGYIDNAELSIHYGDGSFVTGPMALEDVTLGGLKVPKQQIGVADTVSLGAGGSDDSYSGLMGVSYRALTSEVVSDTGKDKNYDGIMQGFVKAGWPASFSVALDRAPDKGGFMAFGGVPPVDTLGDYSETPILLPTYTDDNGKVTKGTEYTFYTVEVNRLVLDKHYEGTITEYDIPRDFHHSDPYRTIVDTGAYLTVVPPKLAAKIMKFYDPPAKSGVVEGDDSYYVPCDAKAPNLGVQFSKSDTSGVIWWDNDDLILQTSKETVNGKDWCLTGVQAAESDDNAILGDTFLHNVVAVFDIGNSTMHFAQRPHY